MNATPRKSHPRHLLESPLGYVLEDLLDLKLGPGHGAKRQLTLALLGHRHAEKAKAIVPLTACLLGRTLLVISDGTPALPIRLVLLNASSEQSLELADMRPHVHPLIP